MSPLPSVQARKLPSRARAVLFATILPVLLAFGCDETPEKSAETIGCSSQTPSVFLKSRTDDDDGDGYERDEDFPAINDEDDDIMDHAWIRDRRGIYHLFFHTEGLYAPNDIEHYTSTDLRSLEYVGVALRVNPDGWDCDHLWAPHVIRSGDIYYMFYTGVKGSGPSAWQRIGVATSTDLTNWTRLPVNRCPETVGDGCIYECNEHWTTWSDENDSYNQQCRDPFVIRDSDNQRWVMFATAKSTNQFGVVTMAYSESLTEWTGAGFIDATRRLEAGVGGQTTGGQAENPFVVSYDGTHYLLFTDWQDPENYHTEDNPRTMTQYATATELTADSSGSINWTYRGYTPDPGVNANEVQHISGGLWIMTQSIANSSCGDHPQHRRELRLKCITWGDDFRFDTSNVVFPSTTATTVSNPLAAEIIDHN